MKRFKRELPDLVHVDTHVINSCFDATHVFVLNPCSSWPTYYGFDQLSRALVNHRFYSIIVSHQVISSYNRSWSEGIERESSWWRSRWWLSVHIDIETLRGTDRIVCVDCARMRWKMKFRWFQMVISYIERKMILIYRIILLIYILQWKWSFFVLYVE